MAGRPRTVQAPPCPGCGTSTHVVAHGLQDVEGETRRAFRCRGCARGFVPGVERPSAELKQAVQRVRAETGVPYRLLAQAITNNLGVPVSHTTVGQWCRAGPAPEGQAPCEYLSVLWALQWQIQEEGRTGSR